ncbi:acetyl-CoA C-acetyltransferase [Paenibacillus sp. FSL R7-0179]|uniref:acetyl-CoA C-acetyltransferase n=1 Tax=Paenibacillus sp. FSL R7-0179 TaxID=2921672 RepID=UPI0030F4CF9A
MNRVALVSPLRTAVGSFNNGLSAVRATELGAKVMTACLQKSHVEPALVEQIYLGNVLQAGEGQNPARQAALQAGIPIEVPATTINTVCGSGLHTVALAYNSIRAEQGSVLLAGGMESMSNAPYVLKNARNGYKLGNSELIDTVVADGLTCPINNYHMGITAENIAGKYHISRLEQDEFAYDSQIKAAEAKRKQTFAEQIVPVMTKIKKETVWFAEDEHVRGEVSKEKLAQLKPAFKENGSVTAGNASGINDGAAAVLVMSEDKCKELEVEPFAYIKGYSLVGVDPAYMGMGPVRAIKSLLKNQGIPLEAIDLFEINEAFAAQAIAVLHELELNPEKVNVNGGAIAIGHPVGASGARVLVTLVHEMVRSSKHYGIASLCIGTGMGIAMLVENARY